jgi:hypothetical protein
MRDLQEVIDRAVEQEARLLMVQQAQLRLWMSCKAEGHAAPTGPCVRCQKAGAL